MSSSNNTYGSTTHVTYSIRPTKADIVQRLLEEKHITAEEAVTLLMTEKEIVTMPKPQIPYPYPWTPTYPYVYVNTDRNGTNG